MTVPNMIYILLALTIWILIGTAAAAITLVISYTRSKNITVSDIQGCFAMIIGGPITAIALICVLFDEHGDFVLVGKKTDA